MSDVTDWILGLNNDYDHLFQDYLLRKKERESKPKLNAIQQTVDQMHKRAKLKFPVDVRIVLEQFADKPYEIMVEPMERHVSGIIVNGEKGSALVVNQVQNKTQQRFALAHLAAHFFWHPEETHIDKVKQRVSSKEFLDRPSVADIEANEFARRLLMPTKEIHHWIERHDLCYLDDENLYDMAVYFGVSQTSMTLRLQQVGFIRQDTLL